MTTGKLSPRQQAQLAFLQTLPPKFQRMHAVIEEMAANRSDPAVVRSFARQLDELKANAAALNLTALADAAGYMATMARRTGGTQTVARGLRELLGGLKINYEGALRQASTPETNPEGGADPPAEPR